MRAVAGAEGAQVATEASEATQHVSQAYPFTEIESKWQAYWEEQQTFRTPEKVDTTKPKYYVLDMFPYPRCDQPSDRRLAQADKHPFLHEQP